MSEPGDLHHRLVLEAPVETPDDAGGVVRSYEAAATLWASLAAMSAREALDAAQLGATITHRIVIRKGPGLSTRHRLRAGGRVFRIVSFRDRDESGRFIEIAAEERAD
jgi:SPP1 family predicted phage head-tail adaptor